MKTNKYYIFSLILAALTVFSGNAWGAVGNTINNASNIADATVYYFAGIGQNNTTYYSVLGSDATGQQTGGANATKSNGTKYTFIIKNNNYYILSPNGYYVTPAASNGKLYLSSTASAVTVATASSKIQISTTIDNTTWYFRKNSQTAAANFGGYSKNQNNLILHIAGYRVIYDANGATGGTVPTDNTVYGDNASATIKANTGSLVKTGYTFAGWNTAANGSGTDVAATGSASKKITAGLRLYAKWVEAVSCSNQITLTKDDTQNGSFSVFQESANGVEVANNGTVDNCGNEDVTLVVVPDPAEHYRVTGITASGSKNISEPDEDGNYTVTYAKGNTINTTISVTFGPKPIHTIHFLNNGLKAHDDIEIEDGDNLGDQLPALTNSDAIHVTSRIFAGWTTEDVGNTPVHTIDASKIVDYWTKITGDMTLNALWATTSNTAKAQFIAANESAKTASEQDPVSLTSNDITFTYTSGNIWKTYTPYTFSIAQDTYCTIEADDVVLEKVVTTCTYGYAIDGISDGQLADDGLSVTDIRTYIVELYAQEDKQLRIQTLSVYTYDNYVTEALPCTEEPTVGAASLYGSFALSGVGVKCASVSVDDNCLLSEYGFVWGTSNADGHPNKDDNVLKNTGNYSENYTNTIPDVAADQIYYYRGYAKNNGDLYGYSSAVQSFTPRTVNYNKNESAATGDNPAQQVVNTGGTVTLPAANAYSWTGHTIVKWAAGSASGTQYSPSTTSPAIDASTTFYAIWETNKHKFAWNFNGGASKETAGTDYTAANDEKLFGTEITYPTNESMERTGYTFGSWSLSATTMPDADLTITANWNTVNYTITYNTNGGADIAVGNYNIETATFSLPTPSRDGYTFAGWKTNSGLTGESVSSIAVGTTGNKEYWAAWTANTYEVVFHKNGGQGDNMSNQSFTYDEAKKALSANTYTPAEGSHKYFNGWATTQEKANVGTVDYTDKAEVQNLTKVANGTFNLYAVWVPYNYTNYRTTCCTKYDITAETPENGSFTVKDGDDDVDKACATTTITIAATPASDSYVFNHWSIVDGESNDITESLLGENPPASTSFEMPAKAITINAVFNLKTTEYAVTLHDNNGGEHNGNATVSTNGTVLSNISLPTKEGYHVAGYYLEAGCETLVANAAGTLQPNVDGITDENAQFIKGEAITLYAAWEGNQYTVTLAKNYGSAGSSNVTATFGQNMPNMGDKPGRAGYEFTGYYANNDGTGTKYYNADKSSAHVWDQAEDKTIYAVWSPKNYTITLNNEDADEGHEGTESISVTYDSNDNLTSAITKPEKTGYKFSGYFTEADGAGTQLIDEDGNVIASVSNYTSATKQWKKAGSDEVNLYAFWKACHTVTWSVNGEETPEVVVHGEKVAAMPTPPTSADCDDAKKFIGWRAEKITGTSASAPDGIFTDVEHSPEITDDVTFYAVFATETIGEIVLIKDINDLANGDKVYIYSEFEASETTYGAVAKAYESGNNNVRAASGTVANEKLTPGTGACAYTFGKVKVSNEDYYTFNDGTYYLYAASTSDNHLKGETSLDNNDYGLFTIVINSTTGVASIRSKGNTSRGKMQFNPNSDTGDYTKAIFACYKSSANQTDVKLFKKNPDVYSDFVTTCASCDADATFTTALPAVSAEDCTSATVTATGGLATLGSEGCNISDYGLVLGTATNPELDGEGVTKLQVGTSNPTVGEDFSYDMTGLTKGTHYYVRAYAVNKHGVAYSSTKDFWTKDVSSIAITTAPTKTNYIVGETFDAAGMVVTATLADGSEVDVTEDVTYSTIAFNAAGNVDFPINYSLCETNVQTTQPINVYSVTVNEGTDPSKGDMTYDNAGTITISNLASHTTVEFVKTNADIRDNGDGTFSIINPTGTVSITVNYVTAVEVDVKFFANGTELEGLALSPFQSENFDMPAASAVANAMTAAGVSVSEDVHFVGWSASKFPYQTSEPTMIGETGKVTAATSFYAVFSNIQKVRIDEGVITGSYHSSETEVSAGEFTNGFVHKQVMASGAKLQFHKGSSDYGYVYNKAALAYINKIVIGYAAASTFRSDIDVYACSDKKTITGSILVAEERGNTDPYVYRFPDNISYFWVKGDNFYTYVVDYIDIYYAEGTGYYTTQFSTLTFNKADGTTDKTEKVATGKTRTLSADDAPAAVAGYTFMEKWSDGANDYVAGDGLTVNADMTLNPYSSLTTGADVDINDLPATVTEIVVTDGKTLNVDAASTLDNLTVEAGGQVTLSSNKLTVVGTFTIETTMASGKSGQLNGATESNFEAQEDAYIDITLGDNGNPNKWHAFTVPFPVDAMNGIYDLDGNKLTNEVNYAIMDYHGDIRATGAYGWKKYRGVLVPGTFYLMTVDGARTTYRFKKTANGALVAGNTKALYKYASSTGNNDNGWNGVGNPTLVYGKVDQKVQVLNPVSYTYEAFNANETNFIVGTPFFIQATEDGTMTFGAAGGSTNYAPARTPANEIKDIKVTFGNEEYTDKLYISASEDALATYETGKDLVKMTMTSAPKVAQIFGKAYNAKLCMVNAPMVDDKASYALSLYAPADGTYRIETPTENENADLYLTKDGRVMWNLSMSACEVELSKGTTESYGLLLVRKAPGVATGMENVQSDNVQCTKVIIDNQVFILRGGQMYDVTGKAVK